MKVVYVAGAFRADTPWQIELNVRRAEEMSLGLWRMGLVPICPHTQTRFFQFSAPDQSFLEGTLEMMRRCDAVMLLRGWEASNGTIGEIKEAQRLGIPVFTNVTELARWAEMETYCEHD